MANQQLRRLLRRRPEMDEAEFELLQSRVLSRLTAAFDATAEPPPDGAVQPDEPVAEAADPVQPAEVDAADEAAGAEAGDERAQPARFTSIELPATAVGVMVEPLPASWDVFEADVGAPAEVAPAADLEDAVSADREVDAVEDQGVTPVGVMDTGVVDAGVVDAADAPAADGVAVGEVAAREPHGLIELYRVPVDAGLADRAKVARDPWAIGTDDRFVNIAGTAPEGPGEDGTSLATAEPAVTDAVAAATVASTVGAKKRTATKTGQARKPPARPKPSNRTTSPKAAAPKPARAKAPKVARAKAPKVARAAAPAAMLAAATIAPSVDPEPTTLVEDEAVSPSVAAQAIELEPIAPDPIAAAQLEADAVVPDAIAADAIEPEPVASAPAAPEVAPIPVAPEVSPATRRPSKAGHGGSGTSKRVKTGRADASRTGRSIGAPTMAASCPYCALLLQPPPEVSRRCPRCRERIIVKRVDGRIVYLTEASVRVFDAERRRMTNAGRWIKERQRWLKVAADVGAPADRIARLEAAMISEEVVTSSRGLYAGTVERSFWAAKRDRRWEDASGIMREHAVVLYRMAGSPIPPPDEVVKLHRTGVAAALRGIGGMARDAELVSGGCCEICQADDGRTFRITDELRVPRLPHEGCPKGLCRCDWYLAERDQSMVRRHLRRRTRAEARAGSIDEAPTGG